MALMHLANILHAVFPIHVVRILEPINFLYGYRVRRFHGSQKGEVEEEASPDGC